jgi:hypothetical protein
MRYPYSGIGKDWNYRRGEVFPEDRDAWEWMAEEETQPVQAWERQWQTTTYPTQSRVDTTWTYPDPHVLYDLPDGVLGRREHCVSASDRWREWTRHYCVRSLLRPQRRCPRNGPAKCGPCRRDKHKSRLFMGRLDSNQRPRSGGRLISV